MISGMDLAISQHWNLVWIGAALLLVVFLGSPRHRGQVAWRRVHAQLSNALDKRRHTIFGPLALPTGGGSEAIDHLVVSRFGVFLIVSEYRKGEIQGGESQELWILKRAGRTTRWPNPLYRAKLQMEAVQRVVDLPRQYFHILVAVEGMEAPSRKVPENVLPAASVLPWVRARDKQLFSPEQADRVVKAIADAALQPPKASRRTAGLRWALGLLALGGIWWVYGDEISDFVRHAEVRVEQAAAPERFDAAGQRKSEAQIYEESLICAYSPDTSRCACYEPSGERADLGLSRCRELSERGSVLKQ